MASPTNSDIMTRLDQIEVRVKDTHEQAVKTNGRVTKLEERQIAIDAIEEYQRRIDIDKPKFNWFNLVPYGIALAVSLIAIGQYLNK